MYKLYKDSLGQKDVGVILNGNIAIPFDTDNTDYQEYLKWLAEGNVPESAE